MEGFFHIRMLVAKTCFSLPVSGLYLKFFNLSVQSGQTYSQ